MGLDDLLKLCEEHPVSGASYAPKGEEIIGIPKKGLIHPIRRIARPEDWEFAVHDHRAKKAGRHFDLRIGDPHTGHAHSWALRNWPMPGEKRLAVIQSTHSIPYMDWSGKIEQGYGAGDVDIADRRKVKILQATEGKIDFSTEAGERYTIVTGSNLGKGRWLLLNRSSKQ